MRVFEFNPLNVYLLQNPFLFDINPNQVFLSHFC